MKYWGHRKLLISLLLFVSNAAIAEITEYSFNFSAHGTGTFQYDTVTKDIPYLYYDFGSYGKSGYPVPGTPTSFSASTTATVFGNPPSASVIQDNTFFALNGEGSAYGLRLKSNGTFCVRPDAGVCDPQTDLASGTYSIAPHLPPESYSGSYSFNFSDLGSGYFVYDGQNQEIPLIEYNFGIYGSGSTSFGTSLTSTIFGTPPFENVIQDNTFFALNAESGDAARYSFNFSNYGTGSYIYNQATQESTSFVLDFGIFGSFTNLDSSTIGAIFGAPPTATTAGNGVFLPLKDSNGNNVSGLRFYNNGTFCLEYQTNTCTHFGTYNLAKVVGYGFRLKSDGTYCVRPDAGICNGADDLAGGTYQFSLLNEGEVTSGSNVVAVPVVVDENGTPVTDPPSIQLTFEEITDTGNGDLTVTVIEATSQDAPTLPLDFAGTPVFLDIETTASFSGAVEVCMDYDETGIDETSLELLHQKDDGQWEVITSLGYPDTDENRICGLTSSFSIFIPAVRLITDTDNDGVADELDNCPVNPNPLQQNTDSDVLGDLCDSCPNDALNDADGDGICGDIDNCPTTINSDQSDADNDGIGDACNTEFDSDGDEWADGIDNCPTASNPLQIDADADGIGDSCDICPADANNDADSDGICGDIDNCPLIPNTAQTDTDADLLGDSCDADDDNDGIDDLIPDNCPLTPNHDQADFDGDGQGDACDLDADGDLVVDANDECLNTAPGSAVKNGCSIAQICPDTNNWKNHGAYVKCVAHAAEDFVNSGLISDEEKDAIVSEAGSSDIGKKND